MTAELRFGREIIVGHNAVAAIMRELGIRGLPPVAYRALRGSVGLAVRISCAVHSVEHSQISCG